VPAFIAGLLVSTFLSLPVMAQDPEIISPAPGQITDATAFGDGALVDFRWSSGGAEDYAFFLGNSRGARDIQSITHLGVRYRGEDRPAIQSLPIGVPVGGQVFYLRFFWYTPEDEWQFTDIEYIAPVF
jgi:hypothetical protein